MELYHVSEFVVERPSVLAGRPHLDFGRGFYLTDMKDQAISWASRPINDGKRKYLNAYDFDMEGALKSGYNHLKFNGYDYKWLDFVIDNRRGGDSWNAYDIIEGGIANDRVFNTIELYSDGLISREEALSRLVYEKPNNQICILNQEIVDNFLFFESAEEI